MDGILAYLPIILVVVGVIFIVACILGTWKKVPADKAAIITGMGKAKVVTGGGTVVIPVFQRIDYITLENINFDIGMRGTFTSDAVPVDTDGVVVVKIKNETAMIRSAFEQFYTGRADQTRLRILETAKDVCEGRLREIIAEMTADQLYKDRKTFSERVQEVAGEQLAELGLELKSFTIKGIGDQNGYFDALSRPRIAVAKRDADIAEADAARESLQKTSESKRAGEQARLEAEALEAQARKDAEVKKLGFAKEQQAAKAVADAAYDIQQHITQKDVTNAEMDAQVLAQQRSREVREAEIQVQIAAEMRKAELAEQTAIVAEKELLATKVKPAEAARRVQEIEAEARKVQAVKQAEAEAEAKKLDAGAAAEAKKLDAAAEAERIRSSGTAEAEIIAARGDAEAEAIRKKGLADAEALDAKAEALAKMNEAGKLQMVIEKMPEIVAALAEPMSRIGNISIIGGSDSDGAASIAGQTVGSLKAITEGLKDTIGFDITEVMRAKTFEGQTEKHVQLDVTGIPDGATVVLPTPKAPEEKPSKKTPDKK